MSGWIKNIFSELSVPLPEERVEPLAQGQAVRIERIVSRGHASPPGFWYDQSETEFVLVLQGKAGLRFAEDSKVFVLGPGDYTVIPPHRRHRVEWTDGERDTVWLAVFYP